MGGTDTGAGPTFGDLLRRHRTAANITQEDLAERSGLTPQAISLLERGVRRRPHKYTVRKLAESLGLVGKELASFESAARPPTSHRAADPARRTLPVPPTPLIGREQDVAAVSEILGHEGMRLLTLTGPGGVGKSRLAVEVARRERESYGDGAAFVALAPVRDPDLIPAVLAESLGVRDTATRSLSQSLEDHLRDRELLLVLDNFEHLLPGATAVADLLATCPGLIVLATSRAPLRLAAERQFPVRPLPLHGPEPSADALARSPAVELFCQRAEFVAPGFELTEENAGAVADICRRLDGLPLAIELAAARVKLFAPKALLERLDGGLHLLGGGTRDLPERQRSLVDAIAWSHDLLGEAEKTVFRRLAVFAGGSTLDAAERVCGDEIPGVATVLESLAALVDNSLVAAQPDALDAGENGEPRFVMLETIRQYALERLRSSGEVEEMRRAHARYYLALAEAAQPEASSRALTEWLAILEREHDNLRAALRWAVRSREPDIGARLVLMLWRFWAERYHISEGRRWMESVLALGAPGDRSEGRDPSLPARRWAFLHLVAGILAAGQGDYDRAVVLYRESLALYRGMGHEKGTSGPLRELGAVAYHRGDYERAVGLSEQALAVARKHGSAFGSGLAVCTLSDALRAQGNSERAKTLLQESLTSLRKKTYPQRVANALAITLSRLGSIECEAGNDRRAWTLFKESLDLALKFGFTFDAVIGLEGMARVAAMRGHPERAARLLGASAAMREGMGTTLTPVSRADHDHAVNTARTALGADAFDAAWAAGQDMSLEQAVAKAGEIDS